MKRRIVTILALVMVAFLATTAGAVPITYLATADSFVDSWAPGTNYGTATNYDGMPDFSINRLITSWTIDWGSIGTITSATVEGFGFGRYANPTTYAWQVDRVTRAWTELGVTWNSADTGVPWTTPGGDYTTADEATASILNSGGVEYFTPPIDITDIVKYWQTHPSENYGLLIGHHETAYGFRLYTREDTGSGPEGRSPRLIINYEVGGGPVIPEPATILLVGTGALGLFGYIRRRMVK